MALLRLAGDPTARRGRCGDLACARPPAVGEPPPPSRPARGGPHSPDHATSAPRSAVAAQLVRCAANFDLLSKPFPDSDEVSEGEAVALLKACGFSAQDCTELLRDTHGCCFPGSMHDLYNAYTHKPVCRIGRMRGARRTLCAD